jgi:hypothetical protein
MIDCTFHFKFHMIQLIKFQTFDQNHIDHSIFNKNTEVVLINLICLTTLSVCQCLIERCTMNIIKTLNTRIKRKDIISIREIKHLLNTG